MKRTVLVFGLAAAIVVATGIPPAAAAGAPVNGGGSSFAALEIDQWRADVARKPYELRINYASQGSSAGRSQYVSGTFDFGATDIPFQPGELPSGHARASFVYVPVSAGGIGFMYNLVDASGRRVTDLKLTRRAVCRIFTEPGMKWNDPEIVAHNQNLASISRDVLPIVRQDGSGTSYVFSEFCIAVAPDVWQAFIDRLRRTSEGSLSDEFKAGLPVSNYPTGWGRVSSALAADGVANAIADDVSGRDAITYNEAGFAKVRGFPNASVENAAATFTQPTEAAVTVALGYAIPNKPDGQNEDGTFTINYTGPDPRAYFPSTYSYVVAQTAGFPADKGETLTRFLCYAVTKGQEVAVPLGYARLSTVLVELALRQIARVPGYPGESCAVAGAAPPPPPPTDVATAGQPRAAPAASAAGTGVSAGSASTSAAATRANSSAARGRSGGAGSAVAAAVGSGAGGAVVDAPSATSGSALDQPRAAATVLNVVPGALVRNTDVVRLLVQGVALAAVASAIASRRRA